MKIKLAFKGGKGKEKFLSAAPRYLSKIDKLLPHLNPDLVLANIFIRKNHNLYHVKRIHHAQRDYKPGLGHFEGWVHLILPKKTLHSHFRGATVQEGFRTGMKSLLKEIQKYKDLHFKSQSQYPDHKSIRKAGFNV